MENFEVICAEKHIELQLDMPADFPMIESDEIRVNQIVQNIISNAVKFTEKGGVTITARHDDATVFIRVQDTGIGIAEKDLAHIFGEFRQVDGSSSRNFEGTGLGLTIAEKATGLLCGRISVQSEPGRSSTFQVELPITWKGERLPVVDDGPETAGMITGYLNEAGDNTLTAFSGREVRQGKKILIVEDNPETIIQIKAELTRKGYEIASAGGGAEALAYISHTIPDGIILDLMMPEIDGFAVLEEIRGSAETATTPVLILTAKDLSRKDLSRLSHNNIQQLVQKGDIDLEGLLFKVELMLGNQPKQPEALPFPAVVEKAAAGSPMKSSGAGPRQRTGGRPVLLIIEDNPDGMLTLKAILKDRYFIIEAADGEEGLEKTFTLLPDLVLLDISLPKMDGFTVAAKIKENADCASLPIIALSARAMKGDRERMLAAGCDDYISKPVDPEKVVSVIETWLNKR